MDSARKVTDQQISAMRREFAADYDQLGGSMSAHLAEYLADFVDDEGRVEATALTGRKWARMRDQLAREATELNSDSMRTLDGRLGEVRRITAEGSPAHSAVPRPAIDQRADLAWNRRKVEAAARQGIGRPPAEAGERMRLVADMNGNATARRVRTAINGAENAGRMDAMLARGGSKRWVTVQDERVRDSHAELHGMVVPVDEEFPNGLMFPGDPSGPPEEVYNCRCSLEWVEDAESVDLMEDLEPEEGVREVVEGQDISDTWQRRPDQFDFEIEDVLDAQGFDGLPRIVDADEFDQAVRQANGGNGLIMQRTYSAPDQMTLDAYREQLYSGKWYVDCSRGGSAYGQGMYAVSDFEGNLTKGVLDEIETYKRGPFDAVETMTLDPSARFIEYNDAAAMKANMPQEITDKYTERFIREHADELGEGGVEFAMRQAKLGGYDFDFDRMMELDQSMSNEARRLASRAVSEGSAMAQDEIRELYQMDIGAYAALRGYDAISVTGRGMSGSYTVVLNRTKLIIRRPE